MYTWDYQSSIAVWNGIRVQPVLSDEVMTFKSLILCHKLVQEGHPIVSGHLSVSDPPSLAWS